MSLILTLAGLLPLVSAPQTPVPTDTERVYTEDQLTLGPVVLRQPATHYPDALRPAGGNAIVRVSVVLDRKGRLDSASVRVLSSPDTAFDAPARAVVLGARFAPARVDARAVRAAVTLSVLFDPADTTLVPPIYAEGDSLTQKPALLPSLLRAPEYPEDLRLSRIQGRVLAQMILDTLGRVEKGSIQFVSTPDQGFLMPVSQFLALAHFRPARRDGRPVRCLVMIPVDFRIRGGRPFQCPVGSELPCRR